MDNSNVLLECGLMKTKIFEMIEQTRKILEKRTLAITTELKKMKEESENEIGKFLEVLELNNFSSDIGMDSNPGCSGPQETRKQRDLEGKSSSLKSSQNDLYKVKGNLNTNLKQKIRENTKRDYKSPISRVDKELLHPKIYTGNKLGESSSIKCKPLNQTPYYSKNTVTGSENNPNLGKRNMTPKNDMKALIIQQTAKNNQNYTKKFIEKHSIDSGITVEKSPWSRALTYRQQHISTDKKQNNISSSESEPRNINLQQVSQNHVQIKTNKVEDKKNGEDNSENGISREMVNQDMAGGELGRIQNNNNDDLTEKRRFTVTDIGKECIAANNKETKKEIFSSIKLSKLPASSFPYDINDEVTGKRSMKSPLVQALFILAKSDVLPLKLRILLSRSHPQIRLVYPIQTVIKDYTELFEQRIKLIESELSYQLHSDQNPDFIPSKTAQNGLNFISKEDEEALVNLNEQMMAFHIKQYEPLLDLFKFIYILIKRKYDTIDPQKIIPNLYLNILPQLKVDSIKSMFYNIICHNLNLTSEQLGLTSELVQNNENIFNPTEHLKISRVGSYLAFILKEIYEYTHFKTKDRVSALRKEKQELKGMKEKLLQLKRLSK